MSYKFIALFNAIFMLFDFGFQFCYFIATATNEYFDVYYSVLYGLILIPLGVAAV